MAWNIVEQPNKKLAIFSSIIDSFILWDATEDEIRKYVADETVERAFREAENSTNRMLKNKSTDFEKYVTLSKESGNHPENFDEGELH